MNDVQIESKSAEDTPRSLPVKMKFELLVIPESDVDRAKRFYSDLGWRLDIDFVSGENYRVVQFTPHASESSVMFGKNITAAKPGSAEGMHLIVADIEAAGKDLIRRGIEVSDLFHDVGGVFHHSNGKGIAAGPNPQRKSYASYATFSDPDGNRCPASVATQVSQTS
ncbi:VOC family protein [Rhizobium tubonense]|uniref:VOC family protein n=1 Tax=Rhizobium tubonense TaxID=484088 RepID=UPI001FCEB9C4|nr:VOC family protein [Rhizobium tubonense]